MSQQSPQGDDDAGTARDRDGTAASALAARSRLAGAGRIVVKIGTNVLCRESGELAIGRIHVLIEDLVDAHRAGRQVIVVSSGSIGLGMERLGLDAPPETLVDKQACAAVGQTRLMSVYRHAFDRFGIATAQVLLTEDDFAERARYLNLRNTLARLLDLRVVPIVNENDTVSTSEIETPLDGAPAGGAATGTVFGDNDVLSALVAAKLGADALIMLSDVDGLRDPPPAVARDGERIAVVPALTPRIEELAGAGSRRGRGGMRTKIRAVRIATHSGAVAVVASGAEAGVIRRVLAGEDAGTVFLPRKPLSSRKRWIAYASSAAGRVRVNDGAREALVARRASLLFAGVCGLESEFARGDIVSIVDERGEEFARGIANYSSDLARRLLGRRTEEVLAIWRETAGGREEQRSGSDSRAAPSPPGEFIHRDNIVILSPEAGSL